VEVLSPWAASCFGEFVNLCLLPNLHPRLSPESATSLISPNPPFGSTDNEDPLAHGSAKKILIELVNTLSHNLIHVGSYTGVHWVYTPMGLGKKNS